MNNKSIRARLLKGLEVPLWLNNHEVNIEECIGAGFKSLNHIGTERYRRNERSIHDIDVEPISPRSDHIIHLLAKPRDIRGQDRGGDNNRGM
jgi:hypothetical protein